jgi:hypothetical protein
MSRKRRIVVLGMMTRMPVAGVLWQTLHYLIGFRRLGLDPYYVEAHAQTPSMFYEHEHDAGSAKAAGFLDRLLRRFDLGDRWAFEALHEDGACHGLSASELRQLYDSAELVINLHGGTLPRPEHYAQDRLIYLETDPVALQIELDNHVQETIDFLAPHSAFLTFAENYGRPGCALPVAARFPFRPTRQPIVLDLWEQGVAAPRPVFTTIGNWRQEDRDVQYRGETYLWSKHHEFLKVLDLPARTGRRFELALSSFNEEDRALLERNGWHVRPALEFATDLDAYRDYIASSRGEFTVAKDQNIRLRSGWFSDRSASYLAAGRPVVTQETGFSQILPTGRGLFAFSTLDEAAEAIEAIESDHGAHRHAAREIASEFFDSDKVLSRLLGDVGL